MQPLFVFRGRTADGKRPFLFDNASPANDTIVYSGTSRFFIMSSSDSSSDNSNLVELAKQYSVDSSFSSDDSHEYGSIRLTNDETRDGIMLEGVGERTPQMTRTEMGQIAVNIVVSFVGAGLLGIPHAFLRAGWLLGSLTLCATSALNLYALLLLPKVRKRLQEQGLQCNSYGQMGLLLLGERGEVVVNVCLVLSQTGFATAYLIFIADSLYRMKRWKVVFGCVPGLALLVQAQDMSHLSPFSLLANCSNLLGLSAVLFQDWIQLEDHSWVDRNTEDDTVRAFQFGGLLFVVAVTLYSMEGVGLILSLESSCRNRAQFPSLLKTVVGGITIFMALFGSAGYWAFRSDTMAPITLNLGHSRAASLVQGALCVALYFTYPIMMFPVWNIAENRILELRPEQTCSRGLLRASIVLATAIVAFAVPDFGEYLSLVGSSICTILGFLFPAYFHLKVFGSELAVAQSLLSRALIVGGTLFAVIGTFQSMSNMITNSTGDNS
ncbi:solute carrier family 36 [Fistulifera solaris]|uniref:Solute carrier family 36 n=1 Tax=Fistulifera solaris TaxID=1519565 RepID=A0A1Z5K9U9_FISSO|nr:solute carrier family 36 [Fistulifera solaris]|eukprot:GAX23047.1 solute carrier family 36 [Fistulifera solaris]